MQERREVVVVLLMEGGHDLAAGNDDNGEGNVGASHKVFTYLESLLWTLVKGPKCSRAKKSAGWPRYERPGQAKKQTSGQVASYPKQRGRPTEPG